MLNFLKRLWAEEKEKEVFISVDIEADGRLAGINSLLSLGSVAFFVDKNGYKQISTFEANLEKYPNAVEDEKVMEWWKKFPEAWKKIRENAQPPEIVMKKYQEWLKSLPGKVVFVGYPATYDFMFVFWYIKRFTGEEPFGWSGLCSRTYFTAVLKKKEWFNFSKKDIPDRYKSNHPHDHTPLNDAIEQGQEFATVYFENVIKKKLTFKIFKNIFLINQKKGGVLI